MEDTPHPLDPYLPYWQAYLAEKRVKSQVMKTQLLGLAKKCASILIVQFHAKEVYLIGSLITDEPIHNHSDIDLVVKGLPPEIYYDVLEELLKFMPEPHGIDILTYEMLSKSFQYFIDAQGVLLEKVVE
jgi:uncharacterized protein